MRDVRQRLPLSNRRGRFSLGQGTRRPDKEPACAVPALFVPLSPPASRSPSSSPASPAPRPRAGDPAPGSPAYLARDAQNIADAYGRQTAPDGQLTPAYGLANAQHIGPAYEAQLLAQAATPTRPALTPGLAVPGLEQRQPLPPGLERHPRPHHAGVASPTGTARCSGATSSRPWPGAHDPYTGTAADRPVPRRRDHHRVGAGQRADVLVAGGGPRRARLRRPHLRRPGPGHAARPSPTRARSRTCPTATSPPRRSPASRPRARACRRSRRRTSSTAPRTRSTSSSRRRRRPTPNPGAGSATVNAYNPLWEPFDRSPDPHR